MKVLIKDATIRTVAVEIKSLTVEGRQVTLSVFRQFDGEDVVDFETLTLKGKIWGRVNYHVDCKGLPSNHIHLVWQKGDELRRDCVFGNSNRAYYRQETRETAKLVNFAKEVYDAAQDINSTPAKVHFIQEDVKKQFPITNEEAYRRWVVAYNHYELVQKEYEEYKTKWPVLYSELQAVPLLFIAV